MATIALFVYADRPEALNLAADLILRLDAEGHEVRLPIQSAEAAARSDLSYPEDRIGEQLDLAVSLGGDGSMLRAVTAVADEGVPVLGVNYGSLGYLTGIEPEAASYAVDQFLAGGYTIEERLRLRCCLGDGTRVSALNEAIVEKVDSGRTVNLAVHIDGEYFTSYAADGLIAATPTGSTAYSLSAGGPILAPTMSALILTPVAPHTLFDRSLVLPVNSILVINVVGDRQAAVAVDGRSLGELGNGDSLTVSVSDQPARLVTFGQRGFHQALKSSFGLLDR
ncbi:MAG: NAD(+)/NADH kinase [Acidimicrobiia bacterium]|nr:NAD(+)/NADH kinase [Acidimicrobiia bacterium]MYC57842.1 NAD(+)/NADH kinase [Acidimicrobiia bacterium]MYG94743.1 NAD(+)/NADH kinase [Acidimicrobiia bacterium]MYI30644.1 NAD(+)/NADH kinase [Acidimicrobiia bacterium]